MLDDISGGRRLERGSWRLFIWVRNALCSSTNPSNAFLAFSILASSCLALVQGAQGEPLLVIGHLLGALRLKEA